MHRGRFTSNGSLFELPKDGANRCWPSVEACDWDQDGDQDLFVGFTTGPYANQRVVYENTTSPGGPITFVDLGPLYTVPGNNPIGSGWFASVNILDWDDDGTATWDADDQLGFSPIGNSTTKFTGSYDGGGYTIDNLFINRPSTENVGFFG